MSLKNIDAHPGFVDDKKITGITAPIVGIPEVDKKFLDALTIGIFIPESLDF